MSSATDGEPVDERGLDPARRGRGRMRPWRRKDEHIPETGELDADDIEEFIRRSNAMADEGEPTPVDFLTDDLPDEDAAPDDAGPHEDIASRVASRPKAEQTGEYDEFAPEGDDSVDWGSFVVPDPLAPVGDTPSPAEERAARAEQTPEAAVEPTAEEPIDWGAIVSPTPEPEPAEAPTTDVDAARKVIADALDIGFAEPLPDAAPQRKLWPRRKGDVVVPRLTHAELAFEAERQTLDREHTEAVATLAAQLRRDAEMAAAEQAAERIAAEEAAHRATRAREEADRLAAEQATLAGQASEARKEAEELARRAATAREEAEDAARRTAELAGAESARREEAERHAQDQADRAARAHAERLEAEAYASQQAALAAEATSARQEAEYAAEEFAAIARRAHEERA
uniref:hypothetical protein n=1 Tax=Nocardioides stalactiti TaxID=2755356 RepID=UPI0035E3F8E2